MATFGDCRPALQVLSEYIVRNRGALPKLSEVHLALDSSQQVRVTARHEWQLPRALNGTSWAR